MRRNNNFWPAFTYTSYPEELTAKNSALTNQYHLDLDLFHINKVYSTTHYDTTGAHISRSYLQTTDH